MLPDVLKLTQLLTLQELEIAPHHSDCIEFYLSYSTSSWGLESSMSMVI